MSILTPQSQTRTRDHALFMWPRALGVTMGYMVQTDKRLDTSHTKISGNLSRTSKKLKMGLSNTTDQEMVLDIARA